LQQDENRWCIFALGPPELRTSAALTYIFFTGDPRMANPKLVRPVKAIVVGDVDVICKQIGKYFDDFVQVGREKKFKRKELENAQLVCFATQACAADLKQEWLGYARDHNLPIVSCRRGSEIPELLKTGFDVVDPKEEAVPVEDHAPPESLIKAQQAEDEAKRMVDRAKAASPATKEVGIESLDFLANIQKQVQEKLSAAQAQTDEAMALYIQESEKVKSLEERITGLEDDLKKNEEKINLEVEAKLKRAVEKETIKLNTELRRKEKSVADAEKELEKTKEKLNSVELSLIDERAKLAAAEKKVKNVDMDFDVKKVVLSHHLMALAQAIIYVKEDNKWLPAVWNTVEGVAADPEIATIISRIHDAARATDRKGFSVLIPPMSKDDRDKIRKALTVL